MGAGRLCSEREREVPPEPAEYSGGGRKGLRGGISVEAIRLLVANSCQGFGLSGRNRTRFYQALDYSRTKGGVG